MGNVPAESGIDAEVGEPHQGVKVHLDLLVNISAVDATKHNIKPPIRRSIVLDAQNTEIDEKP